MTGLTGQSAQHRRGRQAGRVRMAAR